MDERVSVKNTLWVQTFLGAAGVGRFYAGDIVGGALQFLLFIVLMPVAFLWAFLDMVRLVESDRLIFMDSKAFEVTAGTKMHKILLVSLLLACTAVVAGLTIGSIKKTNDDAPEC